MCQGVAAKGRISKEDAAFICVEALEAVPPKGLFFEVRANRVHALQFRKVVIYIIHAEKTVYKQKGTVQHCMFISVFFLFIICNLMQLMQQENFPTFAMVD